MLRLPLRVAATGRHAVNHAATRSSLFSPVARRLPLVCRTMCTEAPKIKPDDILFNGKEEVIFEGGKNKVVATLKKLSIANLGFALAGTPILQYITSATGNPGKGIAMSGLLVFFGGGTTAALTWATSTYVLSIKTVAGKESFIVETPTLTGGSAFTEVHWNQIQRPGYHPFVTFEAGGKKYYLDELGEMKSEAFPLKLEECLNR